METTSYGSNHAIDPIWKINQVEQGLIKEENQNTLNEKYSHYFSLRNLFILFIGFFFLMISIAFMQSPYSSLYSTVNLAQGSPMSITVSNEYGEISSKRYPYTWLNGAIFAENYKSNIFTISNTRKSCSYYYSFSGVSSSVSSYSSSGTATDGAFSFEPTTCGQYTLSLKEVCGGATSRSLTSTVYVKYVRREISSLTLADREAFLDAYKTLWEVSTTEGQIIYGDKYKGLYHFAVIHNDAGASPVKYCDEFHGDSGFVNNHVMFGAYLEQSLQLVDPSVSLHYMAYIKYFSSDAFKSRKSLMLF